MLEVKKSKNGCGYDTFNIITDDGSLRISFEGNLDLYWSYDYRETMQNTEDYKKFKITKENYYVYSAFERLYRAIKEGKPYQNSLIDDLELKNKKIRVHGNRKLYEDKRIVWYSDDFAYANNASAIYIEKYRDYYLVTIRKSKEEAESGTYFKTYSVRIRNSGSRYEPYNITFMSLYQELKQYNLEYHQVHIEEYLYQNKTKKRLLSK